MTGSDKERKRARSDDTGEAAPAAARDSSRENDSGEHAAHVSGDDAAAPSGAESGRERVSSSAAWELAVDLAPLLPDAAGVSLPPVVTEIRPQADTEGTATAAVVLGVMEARRSHKHFLDGPVPRETIETLLRCAVLGPNHRMTEPWRFYVLGPRARQTYAELRARVKVGGVESPRDEEKRASIVAETLAIPVVIVVTTHADADDEVRREEDYAAVAMGIQNILLAATALGLGSKIVTGSVSRREDLRALLDLAPDRRIVALVNIGYAAEVPREKPRAPAADFTTWLD